MRPSSLFIFSIEFSQTANLPSQRWCGVSFCTRPELHFTLRVLTVESGEYITMWVQGEPGIIPVMCCTHFSLEKLSVLSIHLCVSVIRWHNSENWFGISDANIKNAAFLPTETSRRWICGRGPCTSSSDLSWDYQASSMGVICCNLHLGHLLTSAVDEQWQLF